MKTPLQIAVLFHAGSDVASKLAEHLFQGLFAGPNQAGLRIPVPFHTATDGPPLPVKLDAADHTLVVALVDTRMACRVPDAAPAEAWADLIDHLVTAVRANRSHAILPVAVDTGAFSLDPRRFGQTSFERLDGLPADERPERLLFHVCTAALHLIAGRAVAAGSPRKAPVTLFLSHSKADLPTDPMPGDDNPVHGLIFELGCGPVDHWYDAKKIPRGGLFPDEIRLGVLESSALVAIVTNTWSSREWCRREMLEAKEARRPILVIDHITDEKPRLFPYLGNAPVMRWKNRSSARKAVTFAVSEALRYQFNLARLKALSVDGDVALGTKPELLSISALPAGTHRVLYPDPPLGEEELVELRKVAHDIPLTTPLSGLATFVPGPCHARVALSLSTAQDAHRYGGSAAHLTVLADDLNLYLMLAGFSIAYGGTLIPDGILDGEANYTERLFGIARSYSPLVRQLGRAGGIAPILNYVGWPIHCGYGDKEHDLYGSIAALLSVSRPEDLDNVLAKLNVAEGTFFPPDTPVRRFAWARGMTAMREAMRDAPDIGSRIVLGGKLSGYVGRYPGVLEEALLDLRKGRPVFILGALGGAARLAYDALRGTPRTELTSDWVRAAHDGKPRVPFYDEVIRLHHEAGIEMKTPEELAKEFADLGVVGLGAALANGLNGDENEELALCTDPGRIVELVLLGLGRISPGR